MPTTAAGHTPPTPLACTSTSAYVTPVRPTAVRPAPTRSSVDRPLRSSPGRVRRQREHHHHDGQRQVEEEDPAPRNRLDDQAAERWPTDRRDARQRRPEADRAPRLVRPDHAQQRQARRRQGRAADSLQRTARDERGLRRGCCAEHGCGREEHDADDERPSQADTVADRPADEVQRRKRQRVAEHDPLLAGEPETQILLHAWQSHDHHGSVEKGERGAEGGCRQGQDLRPPLGGAHAATLLQQPIADPPDVDDDLLVAPRAAQLPSEA